VRADRLWRSFRWGMTVEFIILDGRYDAKIAGENYLSPEQEQFLLDALKASPCVFKCIVNSAPFATLPDSTPENSDRWQQFTQRARIKQFIDDNAITGIVSITGDIHMSYVGRLELEPVTLADAIPEMLRHLGQHLARRQRLRRGAIPLHRGSPHGPDDHVRPRGRRDPRPRTSTRTAASPTRRPSSV
jgi:hypothetical protein